MLQALDPNSDFPEKPLSSSEQRESMEGMQVCNAGLLG